MKQRKNFILGVGISNLNKGEVLEEIKKGYRNTNRVYQISTLNPEFLVISQKNQKFKEVLSKVQMVVPDGIGIILAGRVLDKPFKERITGLWLVKNLTKWAAERSLTVGFVGGRGNVALKTGECLEKTYQNLKFFAAQGAVDIKNEKIEEKERIFSIVRKKKPQILFVAYGAPWQDLWIYENRKSLGHLIAVGVGGAFDEIAGVVKKTPYWIDQLGLKWLWRLINQPWRFKRQLRLVEFILLVLKEKISGLVFKP